MLSPSLCCSSENISSHNPKVLSHLQDSCLCVVVVLVCMLYFFYLLFIYLFFQLVSWYNWTAHVVGIDMLLRYMGSYFFNFPNDQLT